MQTLGSMWRVAVIFGVLSSQAQGSKHQVRHLRAPAAPQTLAVLDDEESKDVELNVELAEKDAEEAVAQAEASGEPSQDTDDDTLPSDAVSLLGEMASLVKANTDMPFGEYSPTCVKHLKKIARTMGDMYGDVQIRRVLKNECHVDKESPSAVETGFDKHKECLDFADRFPKAMKDERRGKNGFKNMCKDFFAVQDKQETVANVASAAKDAAKTALADGKSPEEVAAAAAKAAYKAALAAGKSPQEARAIAAAAAAIVSQDQARAAGKSKAEIKAAGQAARKRALKIISEEQSKSVSGKKKSKKGSKKKSDKKTARDESDEDEESDPSDSSTDLDDKNESMENTTDNATEEREAAEEKVAADPRRSQQTWWSWLNEKLFGHPIYDAADLSKEDESNAADEQLSTDDANESFLNDTNATNGSELDEDERSKRDKDKDKEEDAEDVVKEAEKEEEDSSEANATSNVSAGRNEFEDDNAEEDEIEAEEDQGEDRRGGGGLFDWLFGSGDAYGAPRMKDDDDDSSRSDAEEDSSSKNAGGASDDDADDDSSSKKTGGHRRKRGHHLKKARSDDSSTELAKGVTSQDLESLDDVVDDDGGAAAAKAGDAYINSCVIHLRKVAKVIDKSYSDVQAEEALESQCNLDKEFGSVRHESFKRRKECKVFAKLFLKARLQEINGGKTGSYKKLCSWYYKYEDKAFD